MSADATAKVAPPAKQALLTISLRFLQFFKNVGLAFEQFILINAKIIECLHTMLLPLRIMGGAKEIINQIVGNQRDGRQCGNVALAFSVFSIEKIETVMVTNGITYFLFFLVLLAEN